MKLKRFYRKMLFCRQMSINEGRKGDVRYFVVMTMDDFLFSLLLSFVILSEAKNLSLESNEVS